MAERKVAGPVSFNLRRLEGKVAIVTGSGNGFGESIANAFAREGAKIVVADLDEQNGRRVADAINSSGHAKDGKSIAHFVQFDCTSKSSWETLLSQTLQVFHQLDILVNNAGTTYRRKTSIEVTEPEYSLMMTVNCNSIFLSTSVIVPYFIKAGGGVVLNTSSVAGLKAPKGQVFYAGSKSFVNTVTQGLAAEYGEFGVRFNALCPLRGITRMTEVFSGVPDSEAERARFAGIIPVKRMLDHGDITNTAVFLASDEANFLTGLSVPIDGGFLSV